MSIYQGSPNWTSVHSAGYTFAFAKATEGTTITDPDFTSNMVNGKSAGLYMGAYDFAHPSANATSAVSQANFFDSVAGQYFSTGYLAPALDLEEGCGTLNVSQMSQWIVTWMNTVESYIKTNEGQSITPVIYMSATYAAACVDSSVTSYPLWIANWGVSSPNTGKFSGWGYWQYSDAGNVSGINGATDLNYFNGTLSQLQSSFTFGKAPLTSTSSTTTTSTPEFPNVGLGFVLLVSITVGLVIIRRAQHKS
ncbi:MAG TPA: glycoside hydrolase family 25 protein [Nitrososphaerales archaeon]|nr:glycoside hydrolase family 25 protein [Nitrososphaerales archaeon]